MIIRKPEKKLMGNHAEINYGSIAEHIHISLTKFYLDIALCAINNFLVFVADATNIFSNSHPPEEHCYVDIYDQYAEWYGCKYEKTLDRSQFLSVYHDLQGNKESPKLWEKQINEKIGKEGSNITIYESKLYRGKIGDKEIIICRYIDYFFA